jgi:hypothetical protein
MAKKIALNAEVTSFLDDLNPPLRKEIEQLRHCILSANAGITENIKWNGPNYRFEGEDRITMRIPPPGQLQLIFHRGAKVLAQPDKRLVDNDAGLLAWKSNDRAVATFKSLDEITSKEALLSRVVDDWIRAAGT